MTKIKIFNHVVQVDPLQEQVWKHSIVSELNLWLTKLPKVIWRNSNFRNCLLGQLRQSLQLANSYMVSTKLSRDTISKIKFDLDQLLGYLNGMRAGTNDLRSLVSSLRQGNVPKSWDKDSLLSPSYFIPDLIKRYDQLHGLALKKISSVWIGGLFDPAAYLTATKQQCSIDRKVSLEKLYLFASFYSTRSKLF